MAVTRIDRDAGALTMTVHAEFDAPLERVWQMWADPRLLERWWGPPTYPATVADHDLSVGGAVRYFMTGPEGDVHWGWWRIEAVEPPRRLAFEDGFGDDPAAPAEGLPTMQVAVTLVERDNGGTVMAIASRFASAEAMEQLLQMGMEEGIRAAVGQIDALL